MKKLWEEFKKFISRGNVVDMAIGVMIASAFSAIVNALVNNILMPLVTIAVPQGLDGLVTILNKNEALPTEDTANFVSYWGVTYDADVVNVINWGIFINAIINFIIIAVILFIILKVFTTLNEKRKKFLSREETLKKVSQNPSVEAQKVEAPKPSEEVLLLREIRDALKSSESKKEE